MPERVVAERLARGAPVGHELCESGERRGVVGLVVSGGEAERYLARGEPVGEALEQLEGVVGRRAAIELRVEVREQDVVGRERLVPAGDEPRAVALEHERRGGEALHAVADRRLALQRRRGARRRARQLAVAL